MLTPNSTSRGSMKALKTSSHNSSDISQASTSFSRDQVMPSNSFKRPVLATSSSRTRKLASIKISSTSWGRSTWTWRKRSTRSLWNFRSGKSCASRWTTPPNPRTILPTQSRSRVRWPTPSRRIWTRTLNPQSCLATSLNRLRVCSWSLPVKLTALRILVRGIQSLRKLIQRPITTKTRNKAKICRLVTTIKAPVTILHTIPTRETSPHLSRARPRITGATKARLQWDSRRTKDTEPTELLTSLIKSLNRSGRISSWRDTSLTKTGEQNSISSIRITNSSLQATHSGMSMASTTKARSIRSRPPKDRVTQRCRIGWATRMMSKCTKGKIWSTGKNLKLTLTLRPTIWTTTRAVKVEPAVTELPWTTIRGQATAKLITAAATVVAPLQTPISTTPRLERSKRKTTGRLLLMARRAARIQVLWRVSQKGTVIKSLTKRMFGSWSKLPNLKGSRPRPQYPHQKATWIILE